MKAIITKIIIKKKGGIVKAMFSSNSNSISIKFDDTLSENQNHLNAAIILCNKLDDSIFDKFIPPWLIDNKS